MALTTKQKAVLEYWVNNPSSSNVDIIKAAKISETSFYRWRKEKEFMDEYHRMCQERFAGLEAKAVAKLEQQVEEGNFSAVKYVLDGQGYAAAQKIDLETNVIKVTLTDD